MSDSVTVPREPTEAMIEAATGSKNPIMNTERWDDPSVDVREIWEALLAAAPPTEAQDQGPSATPIPTEGHDAAVLVERVRHLAAWIGDERWKDRGGAGQAWNARYVLTEAADRLAAQGLRDAEPTPSREDMGGSDEVVPHRNAADAGSGKGERS